MDLKNLPDTRRVFVSFPHRTLLSLALFLSCVSRTLFLPSVASHLLHNTFARILLHQLLIIIINKKLCCQSPLLQRVSKCKQIGIRISNDQELEKTKNQNSLFLWDLLDLFVEREREREQFRWTLLLLTSSCDVRCCEFQFDIGLCSIYVVECCSSSNGTGSDVRRSEAYRQTDGCKSTLESETFILGPNLQFHRRQGEKERVSRTVQNSLVE